MEENLKEKVFSTLEKIKIEDLENFNLDRNKITGINFNNGNIQFTLEIEDIFKKYADRISKISEVNRYLPIDAIFEGASAYIGFSIMEPTVFSLFPGVITPYLDIAGPITLTALNWAHPEALYALTKSVDVPKPLFII